MISKPLKREDDIIKTEKRLNLVESLPDVIILLGLCPQTGVGGAIQVSCGLLQSVQLAQITGEDYRVFTTITPERKNHRVSMKRSPTQNSSWRIRRPKCASDQQTRYIEYLNIILIHLIIIIRCFYFGNPSS